MGALRFAIIFAAYFIFNACGKKQSGDPWKRIFRMWDRISARETIPYVHSHIHDESIAESVDEEFLRDLTKIISANQNPLKEHCSTSRFLILQMSTSSFEGVGSLLKQVMLGVSSAMHSNRTLIWGLGLPFMFEHSRDLWAGKQSDHLPINTEFVNCSDSTDINGGPYSCFFQHVSTCSLEDIAPQDIIEFSHNQFNDSAPVAIGEIRRGISMYIPPFGLFEYILNSRREHYLTQFGEVVDYRGREAHFWSSAIAAYVFRLKADVLANFKQRENMNSLPWSDAATSLNSNEVSMSAEGTAASNKPAQVYRKSVSWGIHVRHGDLKAMPDVYSYKKVYDFNDYFGAAQQLSVEQRFSPDAVFIATDSANANQLHDLYRNYFADSDHVPINNEEETPDNDFMENEPEEDDYDMMLEELSELQDSLIDKFSVKNGKKSSHVRNKVISNDQSGVRWYNSGRGKLPELFVLNNTLRYRTPHGSHTVASNGGCYRDTSYESKGMKCAMQYEDIVHYQGIEEHRAVPRSQRIMRVLYESIEDLYLLSQCDAIIAQASSHFSTVAALLIWARTGMKNHLNRVRFLDQTAVSKGITPTAFLHGMNLLNGTNALPNVPNAGAQRWKIHKDAFFTGLESALTTDAASKFPLVNPAVKINPWQREYDMKIVDFLPHIPPKGFYIESSMWLGNSKVFHPMWPGQCPEILWDKSNISALQLATYPAMTGSVNYVSPKAYVIETINLGVDHLGASHTGESMRCWGNALRLLEHPGLKSQVDKDSFLENAIDIVKGNMKSVRVRKYAEYVINEQRTGRDFMEYNSKYMSEEYVEEQEELRSSHRMGAVADRVDPLASSNDMRTLTHRPKDLMTLEEINEEIIKLTEKLNKLTGMRDKMVEYSKIHAGRMKGRKNK